MIQLQLRHDTSANWSTVNPVLKAGEIGIEDNALAKIGDGATSWNDLDYFSGDGIDSVARSMATSNSVIISSNLATGDSKAVSLSTLTSTADSKAVIADSKAVSAAVDASTADSKALIADSKALSVSVLTSTAQSSADVADSKAVSVSVLTSTADSKAVSGTFANGWDCGGAS